MCVCVCMYSKLKGCSEKTFNNQDVLRQLQKKKFSKSIMPQDFVWVILDLKKKMC